MRMAIGLARRQLGRTWPNPAVGAVVVQNGQVLATGVTATGGRPHAETQALAQAGEAARGATLYVSLEPCTHHGQTPPCTDAIIRAGISRVVMGCTDANPAVSGTAAGILAKAGMEVAMACEAEAREVNAGFFSVMEKKRPLVTLKIATSLDGKIASSGGQSQWITGENARNQAQLLRARHDAILTGMGTVLADDPLLTCRLPGLEQASPVRIVIDRQHRLDTGKKLVKTAKTTPLWVISGENHPGKRDLEGCGAVFLPLSAADTGQFLPKLVGLLAEKGITRLLVEAGGGLSTAFLQSGLVDRMVWMRAPVVLGEGGMAAFGTGFPAELAQAERWKRVEQHQLGSDIMDVFHRI
ncbi:MAG: bifunctional diaminohydroxyphosphoribosylaminopyrimidine deaminase/5-amino-6-(5-phosphoribosylamino)uracil reductase RibD [Proteobacteria bacterium]|nr:bifunctional diaminohydroxyphosphoribosylaminopyrimidine deaminase/5-amino-6-(5-phosphoribosylamino)uracil reductase RibD [Pseudomonadota bacterium]